VPAGRIPYDPQVTRSQIAGRAVVEASDGPAATAIRQLWDRFGQTLQTMTGSPSEPLVALQTQPDKVADSQLVSAKGGQLP
jgi:hypothetical protein